MNRSGFISVFALLMLSLIFMNVSFLLYVGSLQFALSNFSKSSIKANYALEDRVNKVIYNEEKFNEHFRGIILNESRRKTITESQVWELKCKDDNIDIANFKIVNREKKRILAEFKSEYQEISPVFKVYIEPINKLYEMNLPLVDENLFKDREIEFEDYLDLLEREVLNYDFESKRRLEPKAYRYNIYDNGEIILEQGRKILFNFKNHSPRELFRFTNEILILNLKSSDKDSDILPEFHIGKRDSLETINIKGVLYLEGDLIINQNMNFEGIIVINKGSLKLKEDVNLKVEGIVFYKGEDSLDLDSIDLKYHQKNAYIYGSYLPGYIDQEITIIKKQ